MIILQQEETVQASGGLSDWMTSIKTRRRSRNNKLIEILILPGSPAVAGDSSLLGI